MTFSLMGMEVPGSVDLTIESTADLLPAAK